MGSHLIELPAALRDPKFRFVKLGSNGKKLKAPIEIGWNIFDLDELKAYIERKAIQWDADDANGKHAEMRSKGQRVPKRPEFRGRLNNYSYDEPEFKEWLKQGRNYGVTGAGGLVKLESDDVDWWEKLGVVALLPETFTVQSSTSNRQHFYFYCPEVSDCPLFDPGSGEDIGHIRGTGDASGRGGMVVGPGSMHPSRVKYIVIKEVPIASISHEVLEKIKQTLGKPNNSRSQKDRDSSTSEDRLRVTDDTKTDPFRNITCTQVLGQGWDWHYEGSQKAGPNPYGNHTNKTGHNLVISDDDTEFYCFACNQGGGVSRLIAIKAGIMRCDQPGSPTGRDWWNTIRYALKEGWIDETATAAGLNKCGKTKERTAPTLKEALLAMDTSCDGATSKDCKGFNKYDALFGKAMGAKVRSGLRLTTDEYKETRRMLEKYNRQLVEQGIDIRLIPKKQPIEESVEEGTKEDEPIQPEVKVMAEKLLRTGDCVQRRLDYIQRSVEGDCKAERVLIYCAHSAFLPTADKLHADVVGSPQVGKSKRAEAVLETMPPENVIMVTDASPKSLYYMSKEIALEGKIIYIDDVREEHIPVLKTFRNDSSIPPRNISVNDGEFADMKIRERPIVLASSVQTLNDLEGQAISRSFLITLPDPTKAEEKRVRKKIRTRLRAGALLAGSEDKEQAVLKQAARILRDEGIKSVLIPYDAEEPESADRRGTGQFMRLIKISAFMNQFQRPTLEMADGTKHILAIYKDLENAAEVWFDFETAQEFKIPAKAVRLIRSLPTNDPEEYGLEGTVSEIAKKDGVRADVGSEKTVGRWLEHLYNAGLANRKQVRAPGNPWAYWIAPDLRQRILSEIPTTGTGQFDLGHILDKSKCLKYMAQKSPDSLLELIYSFFTNKDIINRENIKGIISPSGQLLEGCLIESYLSFWQNGVLNTPNGAIDSEYLGQSGFLEKQGNDETKPEDSDRLGHLHFVQKGGNLVQDKELDLGIEAELKLAEKRQKEWEERFTPDRKWLDNKDDVPKERAACPICGDDIGPGHSSRTYENVSYCTSCPTHVPMILASMEGLTLKNPLGSTTTEIYEELAGRNSRPPKREHLASMLRAIGAIERDGRWVLPSTKKDDRPRGKELTTTEELVKNKYENSDGEDGEVTLLGRLKDLVAQYETEKKNIVPTKLARILGHEDKLTWLSNHLKKMGFEQTTDIDPVSHMCIWKNKAHG
jgi:hypothetical protein